MLAVDSRFRKKKIGSTLVRKAIEAMIKQEADEVSSIMDSQSAQTGYISLSDSQAPKIPKNLGLQKFRHFMQRLQFVRQKMEKALATSTLTLLL